MRKKLKRSAIVLSAALSVIILSYAIGFTIAYLSKTVDKENKIIVGHGDTEISEEFSEPSEQSMTNDKTQKEIYVKNTGTVPCFVRVYAEFSDSTIADKATVYYDAATGDTTTETNKSWSAFKAGLASGGDITSDWEFIPLDSEEPEKLRGYFYYKKKVQPNETTPKIFNGVSVDYRKTGDDEDSNIDRIIPFEMIVYSETVQTVETGVTQVTETVNGETVTSTVHGVEYTDSQWKDAWKSYLQTG